MTVALTRCFVCMLALLMVATPSLAQLLTKTTLSLDAAKQIAAAAEAFARKNDWHAAIAILDEGGNLLYFQRMDDVQIGSIEVAMRKAESAIKFKRPSKAFSEGVSSRPQLMALPGAFAFEGGLPIVHEGDVIGAIGVSGMTAEQDGVIAKAGLDALAQPAAP